MRFKLPLDKRLRVSVYRRERYASDPAFRLYQVNDQRKRRGLEPLTDANEIPSRQDAARIAASRRGRDHSGRFA